MENDHFHHGKSMEKEMEFCTGRGADTLVTESHHPLMGGGGYKITYNFKAYLFRIKKIPYFLLAVQAPHNIFHKYFVAQAPHNQ